MTLTNDEMCATVERATGRIADLEDTVFCLREALHDLVMLKAQDEIGCVPAPTKEQWAKAWANAEEFFQP